MDIKSQLKDAQFEHVTEATKGSPIKARSVYATDTDEYYIGNGTVWIKLINSSIGDVKISMLEDGVFQTVNGSTWVIADGRDVTGSDYHTLTGSAFIPDLRGVFLRGKSNGRHLENNQGTDFENELGSWQQHNVVPHSHTIPTMGDEGVSTGYKPIRYTDHFNSFNEPYTLPATTGDAHETRPNNVTVNYFIKINK